MIRNTLIALGLIATAATALAASAPFEAAPTPALQNVTVIAKNEAFPVLGPLTVETCAKEDCSDTP